MFVNSAQQGINAEHFCLPGRLVMTQNSNIELVVAFSTAGSPEGSP